MSRTVIFLGAGASKGLGLPLTNEIFPYIVERLLDESGQGPLFGGEVTTQERLKRCLSALLPGWSAFASHLQNRHAWRDTLPPITDLLSAVDYLLLSANAPGPDFSRSELALTRVLLERAMFELLVRNESPDALRMKGVPAALYDEWRQTAEARLLPLRPPEYHHELQRTVDWLLELADAPEDRVTLISTNYDIEVEQALYTRLGYDKVFRQVDFGMRVREPDQGTVYPRPADARFGVYKLHGSLNWLRCDVCDNVYLNPLGAIAYLSFLLGDDEATRPQDQAWLARLKAGGADQCHCRYRPLRHVIVAPSFVREVRDPILLEIWRNALEALRQADEWIIVGYSLPPEDVAIRSMFLRAYKGRDTQSRPRVVVVQKEEKEPERTRYQLLLPEHCYETGGISGYLDSRISRHPGNAPDRGDTQWTSTGVSKMASDRPFTPDVLDKTVIAVPLLEILKKEEETAAQEETTGDQPKRHPIIIDLNLEFAGGRKEARKEVLKTLIPQAIANANAPVGPRIDEKKSELSQQYLFGEMEGAVIRELVRLDMQDEPAVVSDSTLRVGGRRAIYRIWPDFEFEALTTRSISTVKADAARNAFGALGEGIVWAVMDSGIDGTHPHFLKYKNLELTDVGTEGEETSIQHRDFTRLDSGPHTAQTAVQDRYGHGTHVAGIIAGETTLGEDLEDNKRIKHVEAITAEIGYRDHTGTTKTKPISPPIKIISGMAPKCKLLSLKVLDDRGTDSGRETPKGRSSNIIAAIEYIQEINGYGRRLFVHGVNMSVGYEFEPKWFACGQSPLCVEVDRLVRSGVVVVVASGNTGYGITQITATKSVASGLDLTINDPGNAELAITVGSTHREMPHVYGVSYFSSKGPTGDGRLKPDLIAPGEKIISCDSDQRREAKGVKTAVSMTAASAQASPQVTSNPEPMAAEAEMHERTSSSAATVTASIPTAASDGNLTPTKVYALYREDSGTSMAAPHVSGVIAAFLSVRREFIGQAERVKEIFLSTATNLRRDRYFQGHGLVDLMRAIQSV